MLQRERRCGNPCHDADEHRGREDGEADPAAVVSQRVDVIQVVQETRRDDERHVDHDEHEEPHEHEEVQGTRGLDAQDLAHPLETRRQRR